MIINLCSNDDKENATYKHFTLLIHFPCMLVKIIPYLTSEYLCSKIASVNSFIKPFPSPPLKGSGYISQKSS